MCNNKVSQALGECGVTLVDATFALANDAVELMGVDGAGAHLLGSAGVWAEGEMLAG